MIITCEKHKPRLRGTQASIIFKFGVKGKTKFSSTMETKVHCKMRLSTSIFQEIRSQKRLTAFGKRFLQTFFTSFHVFLFFLLLKTQKNKKIK